MSRAVLQADALKHLALDFTATVRKRMTISVDLLPMLRMLPYMHRKEAPSGTQKMSSPPPNGSKWPSAGIAKRLQTMCILGSCWLRCTPSVPNHTQPLLADLPIAGFWSRVHVWSGRTRKPVIQASSDAYFIDELLYYCLLFRTRSGDAGGGREGGTGSPLELKGMSSGRSRFLVEPGGGRRNPSTVAKI